MRIARTKIRKQDECYKVLAYDGAGKRVQTHDYLADTPADASLTAQLILATWCEQRNDGWWITGDLQGPDIGPYDTLAEAEDDRLGIERFFLLSDEPGFMTVR